MKVLHITEGPGGGYEEAVLIANNINERNGLSAITIDGLQYMSGGLMVEDTPEIRKILDSVLPELQYPLVKAFRTKPRVKREYLEI